MPPPCQTETKMPRYPLHQADRRRSTACPRPTVIGLGDGSPVTLRWILIHVLEDTIRHTGQLDILRENIDGRTGDHPPQPAIK